LGASWYLSLREGVTVSAEAGRGLVLSGPGSQLALRNLPPALGAALRRLAHPGDAEDRLTESIRTAEGPGALARWYYHLQHLARGGWLVVSVRAQGLPLATLVPVSPAFVFVPAPRVPERPCVLSRFAYLRREGETMVLESPGSHARLVLHDARAAALVHALARPGRAEDLAGRVPGLGPEAGAQLLALLACAEMAREVTADEGPALRSWEFHDLLFHARSREGRHDAPVGAVYPQAGRLAPPPACKPVTAAEVTDLHRPDAEQLERQGPPLGWVVERRRSIRRYAAEPITDRQLGEFLYRVGRVKASEELEVDTPGGPVRLELTSRPYPAGGALYELELYVVVQACRGLPPGLYHYDPREHRLGRLSGRTAEVEQLLEGAGLAAGVEPEGLQTLLILAARFQRVAWKYASLAYSLVLKHVGVVYQTMYLTATAMGLAPCALGTGDSDVFARAAGTDYYAEPSVGEFLLGSVGPPEEGGFGP
jgi:SagB-type dehydrogenase family enzyme